MAKQEKQEEEGEEPEESAEAHFQGSSLVLMSFPWSKQSSKVRRPTVFVESVLCLVCFH